MLCSTACTDICTNGLVRVGSRLSTTILLRNGIKAQRFCCVTASKHLGQSADFLFNHNARHSLRSRNRSDNSSNISSNDQMVKICFKTVLIPQETAEESLHSTKRWKPALRKPSPDKMVGTCCKKTIIHLLMSLLAARTLSKSRSRHEIINFQSQCTVLSVEKISTKQSCCWKQGQRSKRGDLHPTLIAATKKSEKNDSIGAQRKMDDYSSVLLSACPSEIKTNDST